jgi:enolase-phosphatase E1
VIALGAQGARAILLDIEGTTTPIAFVHDVLFPFARARLTTFIQDARHAGVIEQVSALLSKEHDADVASGQHPPGWKTRTAGDAQSSLEAYVRWLMDRDRKSPGLKLLQGWIWEEGYRDGILKGQVFPDVAPAIQRWRTAGLDVAIYSSGSVLAQRLLFESTTDGDLTRSISGFFDTAVGAKTATESYRRIARAMTRQPAEIVFVSDVVAELEAAREAGLQTVLSLRPGNPPQQDADAFESIRTFDEMCP